MTIKTRNFTLELNGYLFVRAFGHELFKAPGEKVVIGKTRSRPLLSTMKPRR